MMDTTTCITEGRLTPIFAQYLEVRPDQAIRIFASTVDDLERTRMEGMLGWHDYLWIDVSDDPQLWRFPVAGHDVYVICRALVSRGWANKLADELSESGAGLINIFSPITGSILFRERR